MPFSPQNFVDQVGPVLSAAWLNPVDVLTNSVFQGATTPAQALTALGIGFPVSIANGGTGTTSAGAALAALGGTTLSAATAAITQTYIGQTFQPQTPAEQAASLVPTVFYYPEGDIRRYGATTVSSDNHTAINNALLVSQAGGRPAFIPGGTWRISTFITVPSASSMIGVGTASIINPANTIDGLRFLASDAGIIPRSRFFRDFQIIGTMSGVTNTGAHGIYINTGVVSHVNFENVSILNFEFGAYVQGLYYSVFFNCFIQNCYQGIFFNAQSVNIWITDCTIQLVGASLITGTGTSKGILVQGAPEVEGLHIQGGSIYGYNYNILLNLIFECQINSVDISFATMCPIFFTSVLGPLVIRDCWIEFGTGGSGTWNTGGTGTGNLTGIFITALTPTVNAKVSIQNNYIISNTAITGSTGVYIGNSNDGLIFEGNQIIGYDIGIGGGNSLNNVGGSSMGLSIKHNTINATTTGMLLNSLCTELDLGPNRFVGVSGNNVSFTAGAPTSMVYSQPNTPMKGVATFAAATSVVVVFANAMPFSTYRVALSGNLAGFCWVTAKGVGGFTINCSVSNSNSTEWSIAA